VDQIEKKYLQQYQDKLKLFFITIVAIMVIILAVVILISRTLIHPIRHLSEVANKISMGDLDTPIEIEAKGEVGMLAESIERMQTSVRQAIQRLRKTR
jgi:HAMP domain-containing protein